MKTYKNLYPQIYTFENLYTAYRQARPPFPLRSGGGALGGGRRPAEGSWVVPEK